MLGEIPHFIEANKPPLAILNGAIATLEVHKKPRRKPKKKVASHEAKHAVAALETGTDVYKATIIGTHEYDGATWLAGENDIATLAPDATGEDGTDSDVRKAAARGGLGMAGQARSVIENNMDKVDAVACALEDHGTLDSFGIKNAIAELTKPKTEFGILHIELPTGEKLKENVEIRDNVIMESGIWYQVAAKTQTSLN